MDRLHITDLEAALNHWRAVRPAAASGALAPEVAALAEVYGCMVYQRQDEVDAARRAARKERKQLTKEEQKAARDARYAARKARQR